MISPTKNHTSFPLETRKLVKCIKLVTILFAPKLYIFFIKLGHYSRQKLVHTYYIFQLCSAFMQVSLVSC